MTLEELASRLEELEDARKVAEAKIAALQRSQKRTEELKEDREAVLASLTDLVPQALDSLTGEERNKLYRMLRMEITPTPEGFNATGVFCSTKPTSADRFQNAKNRELHFHTRLGKSVPEVEWSWCR
jgi:DNA repair exonuclease SbcCD ATPase subunit